MNNQPEQIGVTKQDAKNQKARDYRKRWREANPELHKLQLEELREYAKGYREKNRAMINAKKRAASKAKLLEAMKDPEQLEALRAKRRMLSNRWRDKLRAIDSDQPVKLRRLGGISETLAEERRARTNKWFRDHRVKSPTFKLSQTVRIRVNDALRGKYRPNRTLDMLGCTPSELFQYISRLLEPGMTWDNHGHGKTKWTLDHVIPCASFDLNDPEQQKKCFHYTNLKPMWFIDNCRKNSRYNGKRHFHAPTEAHTHLPLPP